jgi:putative SOS response-associated peptidase YedK
MEIMCGRYIAPEDRAAAEILAAMLGGGLQTYKGNTNGRETLPSMKAPVYVIKDGMPVVVSLTWGFRPSEKLNLIFNVRTETALIKPLFRDSLLKRRCIVPAFGFFEWSRIRQRMLFTAVDCSVLLLAGIYQKYPDCIRFSLLTTEPNKSVASVHNRMPLVIAPEKVDDWFGGGQACMDILRGVPPELESVPK